LFNAKSAIFNLDHGKNKFGFFNLWGQPTIKSDFITHLYNNYKTCAMSKDIVIIITCIILTPYRVTIIKYIFISPQSTLFILSVV